jgi:uncharacterized protein YqeY
MEQKIRSLIKEAMQGKDKIALVTYKNILTSAQNTAKTKQVPVTDDLIVSAIKSEIKQLEDVIGYYNETSDGYKETTEKLSLCKALLPQMASEEEILAYLMENAVEKNIGVCMKALKNKFGAALDGKISSVAAKQYATS